MPDPIDFQERLDFFGNRVAYFAVQKPHTKLNVTAISEVTIFPRQNVLELFNQIAWEPVRNILQGIPQPGQSQSQSLQSQVLWQNQDYAQEVFDAKQYLLDSPMVSVTPELAEYARISFQTNRPLVDVVHDLMARIYHDFTYDPTFTTIATPLSDVATPTRTTGHITRSVQAMKKARQ